MFSGPASPVICNRLLTQPCLPHTSTIPSTTTSAGRASGKASSRRMMFLPGNDAWRASALASGIAAATDSSVDNAACSTVNLVIDQTKPR